MPPPKPAYDVDWIISINSNVHVANHRDWFTSYTPFPTTFEGGFGGVAGNGVCVSGIGDVELSTKTHPTRSGRAYQRDIVLHDVLYAPGAFCNIIGQPLVEKYSVNFESGLGKARLTDPTSGACMGLINMDPLPHLQLRGQSGMQTSLNPGGIYLIRAGWAPSERACWDAFMKQQSGGNLASNGEAVSTSLTQLEKKWLKDHYGGEFHFLRQHGLSIYKEEDREEGRSILRALMEDDDDDLDGDESDEGSTNSFLRDLEEDPTSHAADYYFSEQELDWIKKHYGHSTNFLLSYGLKFYDDGDCREGKSIVKAMMEEDTEGSPEV